MPRSDSHANPAMRGGRKDPSKPTSTPRVPNAAARDLGGEKASQGAYNRIPRPEWWTPPAVLALLEAGEYIGNLTLRAAAEIAATSDHQMNPRVLRAEVSRWAETASYGEALTRALSICKYDGGKRGIVYTSDWHDEFFTAMRANNGNPQRAAEAAGVGYGIVLAKIDKRNTCYDAKFHEEFRILEAERVGGIREKHFQAAEDGDVKVQEKILATHAPTQHAPRGELNVTGGIDHSHTHDHAHTHTHGMSADMVKAIAAASGARAARFGAARPVEDARPVAALPAHEPATFIDATPEPRLDVLLGAGTTSALEGAGYRVLDLPKEETR
jgi:hypothetical protein